jgi:hypothetical protein
MRIFPLAVLALAPFTACHATDAAADVPHAVSPTVDLEIEDLGQARHVARYSLVLVDGRADLVTRDAETKVVVSLRTIPSPEPRLTIEVKRSGRSEEIDVSGAIAQKPAGRVLVARVERTSGESTSIVAQVR